MRVGNFSVVIPQGVERETGHVRLPHGARYTIRLASHLGRRSDATVEVDGKVVGTLRVPAHGSVTLETPPDDPGRGCFTFYRADSPEGSAVGLGAVDAGSMGLVRVTFRAERYPEPPPAVVKTSGSGTLTMRSVSRGYGATGQSTGFAPGGTGLSGESSQRFSPVAPLDYDPSYETVISLRLVAGEEGPRPLADFRAVSNPVPPPV